MGKHTRANTHRIARQEIYVIQVAPLPMIILVVAPNLHEEILNILWPCSVAFGHGNQFILLALDF